MAHGLGNDFVAVTERHAFFHQVIRQVGSRCKTLHYGGAHIVGFDGHAAHHVGVNTQGVDKRVGSVKQRLFVFLIVFVVCQRLRFHQGNQADQVANHATGFAAHEFGYVGVFLLRHDGRAGAETVGNIDKAETRAHPQNQFFGKTA